MKNFFKKLVLGVCCLSLFLMGCGSGNETKQEAGGNQADKNKEEAVTLNIAYQYGLAYAPLILMQEQKLIEKAYEEKTGKEVTVVWNQMSSGADINTGISSGNIDVGFMGVAPAITGITKNVGYKIFTNLSGQEHGLMTNDDSIKKMADLIGTDKQIALVNIGSIQHIILAKTLDDLGYDAHALDANIVAMSHPDGMTALETGNVPCHLTSNPYIYKEREEENLQELTEVSTAWSKENSFIVGVASENLYEENQELYQALCDAVEEAIAFINNHMDEAAKITCEYDGNSEAEELKYLQVGNYTTETKGIYELATFMKEANFVEEIPASYSGLVFDNVTGD